MPAGAYFQAQGPPRVDGRRNGLNDTAALRWRIASVAPSSRWIASRNAADVVMLRDWAGQFNAADS